MSIVLAVARSKFRQRQYFLTQFTVLLLLPGIHLEKDMCVPSGHTVAKTMCLFEI